MATHEIIKRQRNIDTDPVFFVIQTFATGSAIEHGPYKNEKSAKGRIRDLKAKVLTATPVIGNDVERRADIQNAHDMPRDNGFEIRKGEPINPPPQIGCYPAIPKHAYRR